MIGKKQRQLLDSEKAFKMWVQLGTIGQVRKWMYESRMLNRNGKAFARQSIYRAAWIWAARYPEASFKYLKDSRTPFSDNMTMDKWRTHVALKAKRLYTYPTVWNKLVRDHPDYAERTEGVRE